MRDEPAGVDHGGLGWSGRRAVPSQGAFVHETSLEQLVSLATLLVNLASCTVAGAALAGAAALGQTAYIALTMGFLGGFSTLSTMNCEAVDMVTEGHRGEAAAYLVVTYGSTLGAAALGFALAHAILGS